MDDWTDDRHSNRVASINHCIYRGVNHACCQASPTCMSDNNEPGRAEQHDRSAVGCPDGNGSPGGFRDDHVSNAGKRPRISRR